LFGFLGIVAAAGLGPRDLEILERIARGDARALRTLYDLFGGKVLAVALRVLRDRADAEEIVQETFLELWRRAREFDPKRGSPGAFLVTIARTRAIDRLRARGSLDRAHVSAGVAARDDAQAEPVPLELVEQRRDRERLQKALDELPAEQRTVIEMAYFEGLTQREIATRTGEPLGTVKTRVRLGMEKLAGWLGDDERGRK
jgi:RNA polymerase sigma-70 factor (ECF subfamily)